MQIRRNDMKAKSKLLFLISTIILSSCGGTPSTSTDSVSQIQPITSDSNSSASQSESTSVIELKNFSGVTMTDSSIAYDGEGHTILVAGAPEEATITYQNSGPHSNVGSYLISANISKDGYNDLQLEATLTITKIEYTGLTFKDVTVEYDGLDHKADIVVVGVVPDNTVATYVYKQNNIIVENLVEVGVYDVEVMLVNPNFNPLSLTAKLTIKATEIPQHMVNYQGRLYFSNALDSQMLYSYDGEEVIRVSADVPLHFVDYGTKKAFISQASFLSSIKTIDDTNHIEVLNSVKAQYMVSDGNIIYYVVNKLFNDNSGIFKMTIGIDGEPVIEQLYIGKAKNLEKVGTYLYFADGRNSDKLSRISINSTGSANAELVIDKTVKELVGDGTRLIYVVNNLLGDYLETFLPSTGTATKLTIDSGKYLQIVGNEVYYSNVDILTSTIYGKGIYRVPLDGSYSLKSGIKVIDGEDYNLSSLYHDNGILYYYRVVDKHLYALDLVTQVETDILEGFVTPEYIPLSTGGKTVSVGTKVYYTNIYQNKSLFVYDRLTNKNTKLTSSKVEDFYINGQTLYLNQVSWQVNNDLFSIDLKTGGIPNEISSDDAREIVSDDTHIYYVRHNAFGVATAIVRSKLDGSEQIEFFDKGATNLRLHNDKLFFLDGGKLFSINLDDITQGSEDMSATQLGSVSNIRQFELENDIVYYTYIGTFTKELRRATISNFSTGTVLASKQTDPKDFVISGDNIYYYSQAESAGIDKFGIYRVNKFANGDETQVQLLVTDNMYYASSLSIANNYLAFVSYSVGGLLGNSHIYLLDVDNPTADPIEIDTIGS